MANALNWFEIPVTDLGRAKAFYEKVLDTELIDAQEMDESGMEMAMFPASDGVGGGLVKSESWEYVPSRTASLIYLNGGDDLSVPLSKVEAAGGEVIQDKMGIGENGFIALFVDSEGNRVGLHSVG